ncbi:uncharacterized protein DUF4474 [Mobilisporobacter senegalensis]|uniref:Uncharacterized protein DUF4474 n=1 Tax=Mobilisporobacter senegalensis TaxID=1329262 RepID=A0A3N1XKG4_9FIRM|nr:DUF4474 domain-containing protein [Mobilisporobacter senegalensis]ROR27210.1 uncharacterized protein DUF4474 [Mobilisporobacter senegalensis]
MIVYLISPSIITGVLQINLSLFILLHAVYIILGVLLFRVFRRKLLRQMVPETTDRNAQVETLNSELEPFGFSYNYKNDLFYSLMYCWQRNMGYCRFYDEAAAPLSMIIDCEPIRFEYNGRKWLIEFWKGQYGMTTGAEVGVYATTNLETDFPDFFNDTMYDSVSDEERLVMSFSLKKDNNLLFYREGLHWWLTGFKLGEYTNPKSLLMEIRISFPNTAMRDAFVDALFETGYSYENVFIKHYTVYIIFDKPKTKQPYTRTKLMQKFILGNNKFYCSFYKFITRKYDNTLDKLQYLRVYSPFLYRHALSIGKTKEFYKDYDRIKAFFNRIAIEDEDEDEDDNLNI